MTKNWRRWLVVIGLLGLSAIPLGYQGWRLLQRNHWLQQMVQQQLAAKFGDSLAYERLEAGFSGVHLSHVRYAPPGHAFAVSVEKVSVKFRLWDLLRSAIHRKQSGRVVQMGFVSGDSLARHSLADHRLDLSITSPHLILIGDWNSRLRDWAQRQASPSSPASKDHLVQPHFPPDTSLTSSSLSVGQGGDAESTASVSINSSGRAWDLDFIRKLNVRDGKILLNPDGGGKLFLLADHVDGELKPVKPSNRQAARGRKSEATLRGKLLASERENLFVRAWVDMESGLIDSLSVDLRDFALKQLEALWQMEGGNSPQDTSRIHLATANDSIQQALADLRPLYKEWKIGGGVINGHFLLLPASRNRQEAWEESPASAGPPRGFRPASSNGGEIPERQFDRLSAGMTIADFQVTGELEVRDGHVQCGERIPVTVEAINCKAEIRHGKLDIKHGTQRVNQQPVRLSGAVDLAALRRPELDLAVESDSLMVSEFLEPFVRRQQNGRHQDERASRFPIRGQTTFRGRLTGPLRSPSLEVEIHAPTLEIYGQSLQHISTRFSYTPRQSNGTADSTLCLVECSGEFDGMRWKGWGEWDVLHRQQPWRMNLEADGELTAALKKLLPFAPPRCSSTIAAQISGPLRNPKAAGQFTLRVLDDPDFAKTSPELQHVAASGFKGTFTFYQDTLRIETCSGLDSEGSLPGSTLSDRLSNSRPAVEISGEVWPLFRLSPGKPEKTTERPLFKFSGRGVQSLALILGQELPATIFSHLTFDTYLQGNADSVNIRIDGRHKDYGYTLFQLFGYMWAMGRDQRHISGDLKIFPGAHNEIHASYSAVWQDSVFYVADLRAGNWLVGGLEVETRGSRTIKGGVKIIRADLSRVLESVAREVPRYRGNWFGEIRLSGTLDNPSAAGDFWIFDAVFNGVGDFSISGKARLDARGWEVSGVNVRKNGRPFLQGAFGYRRATREPHLELRANDIEISDFLGAVADIPPHILAGRASFEIETAGSLRLPDGGIQSPLTGFIKVRNGQIVWFKFDELAMNLDPAASAGSKAGGRQDKGYAYLTHDGVFLNGIRYEKKNAFALEGTAYLPFNLRDAVNLSLTGDGNFLAVLPDLTGFFQQTASHGHLDLNLAGPYKDLTLRDSYFRFDNGLLKMSKVAPEAHDIAGEAFVDSRGAFINILKLAGKVGDATLKIRNQESPPRFYALASSHDNENGTNSSRRIYHPLRLGESQLHLGTLLAKSGENGLRANIPGLMEGGEIGRFVVAGQGDQDEFQITGPWAHPIFRGRLVLEDVDFMFPFDENAEPADPLIFKILTNIDWDVVAQSRKDNRYVKRIPTALDNVYVNFSLDDDSELRFTGILQDSTFRIEGKTTSTRGTIEYLDLNFRVEKFGAEFDKSDWLPIVYGRAWTVMTDSTGFPYNVYLTLHTMDPITREEVERGRFQNAYFKLTSDNPNIFGNLQNTQEQILASLGYSVENVRAKAAEAVGISTDNLIFRPLIRPVERQLKRHLGLDMVRLSSRFTRNFLVANLNNSLTPSLPNEALKGRMALAMLQSTRLLLGKYLWSDLYLHYIGQVEVGADENSEANPETQPLIGLGLRHTLGLEYRINPAMLLQLEYDYNPLLSDDKDDRKIWLRHSFPVEFPGKAR